MGEVKRYDSYGYDDMSGLMKEHAYGDWVRSEDYDALRAENAELAAALDGIAHPVKYMRLRLKDGELLDGRMAMEVTGSIDFYQAIAIAVLAKHRGDHDTALEIVNELRADLETANSMLVATSKAGIQLREQVAELEVQRDMQEAELSSGVARVNELEAELAALKAQKPVTWRCRIAGSDHWAYFQNKSCRFCEPLYANPVAQLKAHLQGKA